MSEQTEQTQQYDRRCSDKKFNEIADSLDEIKDCLEEIKGTMKSLTRAFPANDLGEPDFDGHRTAHRKMMEREKRIEDDKEGAIKHVRNATLIGGGTIMLTALWEYIKVKVLS